MELKQCAIKFPAGQIYLVASPRGVRGIYWKKQPVPMGTSPILERAAKQLNEYFSGRRKDFDLPFDIQGTDFQKKVWAALARIPYGKTVSYREIAIRIKNSKAVRAVGTANGRNPLGVIVPCHRVIAADGSLGGYAGGLKIKSWLLELERS